MGGGHLWVGVVICGWEVVICGWGLVVCGEGLAFMGRMWSSVWVSSSVCWGLLSFMDGVVAICVWASSSVWGLLPMGGCCHLWVVELLLSSVGWLSSKCVGCHHLWGVVISRKFWSSRLCSSTLPPVCLVQNC